MLAWQPYSSMRDGKKMFARRDAINVAHLGRFSMVLKTEGRRRRMNLFATGDRHGSKAS